MASVNASLAAAEAQSRSDYADCLSQIKDAGQKPDKDSYQVETNVRYLSTRYLSVDVTSSYDCAGAYPNSGIETPSTFDLVTGKAIDWKAIFKPGFLPPDNAGDNAAPSPLTKLYRAHYSKAKDDADCRQDIDSNDPFASPPIIMLNSRSGVVFQPDLAHADQACGTPLTLKAAEIAPYVRNADFLADLKATVKPGN